MNDQPSSQPGAPEPPDDLKAPARLSMALRELSPRPTAIPPALDAVILAQARAHLRRPPAAPPAARMIPFPQWLAWAATLVAGLGLIFLLTRGGSKSPVLAREDIDRNGRVDILDAFALARKLKAGPVNEGVFDVNGDGIIDQQDIDWIARHAVRLHKG